MELLVGCFPNQVGRDIAVVCREIERFPQRDEQ